MFSEEVLAFFEVIMLPSDQPFVVVGLLTKNPFGVPYLVLLCAGL